VIIFLVLDEGHIMLIVIDLRRIIVYR